MENLEERAEELRRDTFNLALEYKDMHLASAFSIIDILISLYDKTLGKDDKFILSKGHGCFSFYALLRNKGYNPSLIAHPEIDIENGINCTTGSLGHGLPIGVGMALAKKIKKNPGKIYVLMGDGECQEGSVWESLSIASHHKLDNLVTIVDYNKIQALDWIENIQSFKHLRNRFESFGCYVSEVDGHSIPELVNAFHIEPGYPYMIIANTIKGKGLSFMENDPKWQSRFPNEEEIKIVYEELGIK